MKKLALIAVALAVGATLLVSPGVGLAASQDSAAPSAAYSPSAGCYTIQIYPPVANRCYGYYYPYYYGSYYPYYYGYSYYPYAYN